MRVKIGVSALVSINSGFKGESQITIISRAEWGARPPRSRASMTLPVPYVIIHHSYEPDVCFNRSQCEKYVQGIQNFHMDTRGWDDIGYNFLVGGNGDVFEGRGWDTRGAHNFHMDTRGWDDIGYNFLVGGNGDVFEGRGWDTRGAHAGSMWNGQSIGICFIGNFTDKLPPEKAIMAGKMLIQLSVERNKLMSNYTLYGHRQVLPRTCPGEEFYKIVTEWKHWRLHMDTQGWDDIGYNFLVGGNGDVFEGRGWDTKGAHAGAKWNGRSIGICFIGNFTDKLPPEKAITAGKMLIQLSVERNKLMSNYTLYGHRQVLPRTCPGEEFYKIVTEWKHWMPGNYTTTSS
ncbi:peptidoglycan-recognition protein SC1a-like [Branchiostoma floridae]|uniref:Peptidoglycan-recognition protein SC1a-like n=1 Tax=Branchiostoma floridae TaxID=7739 RepID=A0A9J7HLF5_BRAFL|nr:peptidoglycan-recognition protein SC1a-like [Branchiostoma floridae]